MSLSVMNLDPKSDEVRVRIHATTVTTAEAKMRRGEPRWMRPLIGVTKPRVRYRTLGTEFAGVVDAVGHAVTRFRDGDEVFGFAGWYIGANADYLCLPADASWRRSRPRQPSDRRRLPTERRRPSTSCAIEPSSGPANAS